MGSGFAQGGGTVTTSFLTIGLFARPHRLRSRAFTLPFWRWWKPWRKGGRRARTARTTQRGGGLWPPPLRWFCGAGAPGAPAPQNTAAPRRPPGRPVRRRPPGRWGLCRRWQDPPYKHRARSFRRRYRLQRNRPLGGTYATPSMGETSVYTLRKWETGQIT